MQNHRARYLVVDTSAFINSVNLHNLGEHIITIPEVIAEVRNKRQYRHLFSLTHDVELRDVFSESIAFVKEFAKKSGDYISLSATDIKLLALTYQLEIEYVGRDHLRESPVVRQFSVNSKPKETITENVNNGLCLPAKIDGYGCKKTRLRNDSFKISEETHHDNSSSSDDLDGEVSSDEEYNTANENLTDESDSEEFTCLTDKEFEQFSEEENDEVTSDNYDDDNDADCEDDGSGWVTSENICELKRTSNRCCVEEKPVIVGCLTTDFAIQNVLMQMGLNVITVDGKVIKQLRTYILRCYACFKTTSNMKRMFCPKCGNKTLKRVSVYLDENGNKCMFINFKKPLTAKGKRFPLPLPQSGKHAVNPRLVEDARRPHQRPTKLAKTKTNALEPDYIAGASPFVMRDIHSRSAQHGFNRGKYVFKYWMRKNPNEPRRNPKK